MQDVFSKTLALRDGQGTFGEIVYHLPILSVDIPNRGAPGSVLEGARTPGAYPLEQLSAVEFTQMCWQVRSNLEHGGYDLSDVWTQVSPDEVLSPVFQHRLADVEPYTGVTAGAGELRELRGGHCSGRKR